jgi:outer membrane protein TolC
MKLVVPLVSTLCLAASASAQTLTPEQAVERALRQNPDLRAAVVDVRSADAAARAADDSRTPVLVLSADGQYQENFSSTTAGIARNSNQGFGLGAGLLYTTDLGTELSVDLGTSTLWRNVNRDPTSPTALTIGPTFSSELTIGARQPLLRGAGTDAMLSASRAAHANRSAVELTRDAEASGLVADVLVAYWELWYASRSLEVQERALEISERQLADARARQTTLGTLARTDVLRFESEAASIRGSIASAESTRATAAIELGRLLGMRPEAAMALVVQTDAPEVSEPDALRELTARARSRSTDLLALDARLEAARHRVSGAAREDMVRLDVTATLGLSTLWLEDDALTGLQLPDDRPAVFGLVGLELELPLGSNRASAEYDGALADLEAAEIRRDSRAQSIEAEVASYRTRMVTARRRAELAAEAARIAGELATAEEQRLTLGTGTTADVVLAQQAARQKELEHLRALVDLASAELRLQHATGDLVERARQGMPS